MSGSVFQGTSALALDAKGRVTVPVRHRDVLMAIADGKLTLTKHPEGCLLVFPRPAWESFRDKLLALPMAADGWRRVFLGSAVDVEIDGSSRMLVSPGRRRNTDVPNASTTRAPIAIPPASGVVSRRSSDGPRGDLSVLALIAVSIANGASAVRVVRAVHVGTSIPYTGAYHPRPDSSSPCASNSSLAS